MTKKVWIIDRWLTSFSCVSGTNESFFLFFFFLAFTSVGNGYITTGVLREILKELDDKITSEDLDQMIEEIDSDGSGTVDFDGKHQTPHTHTFHISLFHWIIIINEINSLTFVIYLLVFVGLFHYSNRIYGGDDRWWRLSDYSLSTIDV